MKKNAPLLFSLIFILLASNSFAGQTTLSTYYPPPIAAYNKIKLAVNYTIPTTTAMAYCTGNNNSAYFLEDNGDGTFSEFQCQGLQSAGTGSITTNYCSSHPGAVFTNSSWILYQCPTGGGKAEPYCTSSNNGTLIADRTGNLHVCINNGQESVYPQQCLNKFCSYDPTATNICTISCNQSGTPIQIVAATNVYQTAANSETISYVCCSGIPAPQGSSWPGTSCTSGATCTSGTCTGGQCSANPPGITCRQGQNTDCQSNSCISQGSAYICSGPPGA